MKKILFFLIVCTNALFAQNPITLTQADMPTAGWSQARKMDTLPLPAINYGNKGANQVYDFSNLVPTIADNVLYQANANTAQFPGANIQITTNGVDYLYTNTTAAKLDVQGIKGNLMPGVNTFVNFSPVNDVFRFATQYGGTFSGSWGFQKEMNGSQVGQPSVSKVRVTVTATFTDTIDGWGKTITPYGAYKSLREKRKETTRTHIEYKLFSFSSWDDVSDVTTTNTVYSYLTKETKGSVLTFEFDSLNNLKDVRVSLIPPNAPVANFTNTINAASVQFTDATDGYPDKYHWEFGDGDTSNVQNPNHTYAANGTYNVCVTVTNKGGSHTYCKNVIITGATPVNHAPVATNDTFNIAQGGTRIVHVAGNDTDQDGDNICMTAVWGSPYATEYIGGSCDMILYQPGPGFTGLDTAYYQLCDNGNPVKCDTGMVIFIVVGTAGNNAPIAGNDTFNIAQGVTRIVNVATNDIDPDGNTICVATVFSTSGYATKNVGGACDEIKYQPNAGFTGKDTAYYQLCDNGSPVKCDTGMVVFNVIATPVNNAPVANNDTFNLLQANTRIVTVVNNDNDPDNNALCVSSVWGSPYIAKDLGGQCGLVKLIPDSTFTGRDTAWYSLCDNGSPVMCDTAMITINVIPDPTLLPVVGFISAPVNIFQCSGLVLGSSAYTISSNSTNADSLEWAFEVLGDQSGNCSDTIIKRNGTNVYTAGFQAIWQCAYPKIQVCLTAYNKFGSTTKCDSTCTLRWAGIQNVSLSNIQLYPNPTNNIITIDMRNNDDDITSTYSAIEIFNVLGEKQKQITRNGQNKVVNISVAGLASGVYVAAITDNNGVRKTLGRFTVSK